ncbi:hypothetical protein GCM10011313_14760 [Mycetocola zhadangensis]|nr:hypothetical protein GCM10011313_14760 [Mycetocola zhadangensis]
MCSLKGDGDVGCAAGKGATGIGEGDTASLALGQRHPCFTLKHFQLLGYGRWRPMSCRSDGSDAAAIGKFTQQVQAANVHVVMLPNHVSNVRLC